MQKAHRSRSLHHYCHLPVHAHYIHTYIYISATISASVAVAMPETSSQNPTIESYVLIVISMFYASYKVHHATFFTHTFNVNPFLPPARLHFRPLSYQNSIWLQSIFFIAWFIYEFALCSLIFWGLLNIHFVAIARYRQYRCYRGKSIKFFVCLHIFTHK